MKIIFIILLVIYDLIGGGLFLCLVDDESSVPENITSWLIAVLWPVILVVTLLSKLLSRAEQ